MARIAKENSWKMDGCACVVTVTKYIKMCAEHEREWQEVHSRWTADKVAAEKERDSLAAIKETDTV